MTTLGALEITESRDQIRYNKNLDQFLKISFRRFIDLFTTNTKTNKYNPLIILMVIC